MKRLLSFLLGFMLVLMMMPSFALAEENTAEKTERPTGIGLRNARQRFRLVMNADFQVESAPGQGTTVTVTIPPPEETAQL